MKVLIRTDASMAIGSGHLMRCLTLADQLGSEGSEVAFACCDLHGGLLDLLRTHGYRSAKLPLAVGSEGTQQDDAKATLEAAAKLFPVGVDWLVVDHYQLDATWERVLRPHVRKLMVIDDLANRPHDCDLLLDQNYYCDMGRRYHGLVPEYCVPLIGPSYVLLRPEFADARKRLRQRDGTVRRILVCFGGSDPTNQTQKAVEAMKLLNRPDLEVDVVVGAASLNRNAVQVLCDQLPNVTFHCQVSNMAELMLRADLSIGAGGATTWERCCLGLPGITMVLAENQLQTTRDLAQFGAALFLDWADKVSVTRLALSIESLMDNVALLGNLSNRSIFLMKDWVGAEAITAAMGRVWSFSRG